MYRFLNTFILLLVLLPESHGFRKQSEQTEDQEDNEDSQVIYVENGGKWGEWGDSDWCPVGTHAAGFSLLVENLQGLIFDDTALNGIRLFCIDSDGQSVTHIESELGSWGNWTKDLWCPSGPLKGFQMNTEPAQGAGDDTSVNNIRFKCDNSTLEGEGLSFGDWGDWSEECENGICGIQTKQEDYQGLGDDTALNDVVFFCCQGSPTAKGG